ncbi:helix-turn-helix transcriptional regulator [Paenibacillus sp. 7124]|uniref:Helix-turn-helix transcriptional regulator n=1 Tax=Paenibacillus apii TaxID=1850370 RepID=A0A6M1PFB0_9BACL|nr:helix-turn-helix transcriptional regulator [Paenibacillus apii]NGM81254.1 helix-turn-helix transcriptional regulator [Paenibacillus apii]
MPYSQIVAENIKRAREARGLEAQELARKLGISKQAISGYDSGRRKWPIDLIPQVADILGVSIEYIYGRERDE